MDYVDTFIEFRCPNRPEKGSTRECRSLCGGINVQTLRHFDFEVPYVDIRYCGHCNGFFKITLKAWNGIPEVTIIQKGEKINFVNSESFWGVETITGVRVKK